jgi:hypothetical protein
MGANPFGTIIRWSWRFEVFDEAKAQSSKSKLGIVVARAAPFLLLDGRRPASQLSMF